MAPDQLARFRAAVLAPEGAELDAAVGRMRASGVKLWGDSLKGTPRGVPKDSPRADLLRMKDLLAGDELGPAETLEAAGRSTSPVRSGTARARAWRGWTPMSALSSQPPEAGFAR